MIKAFASESYGVTFPILQKTEVNGANTNPVFRYLKAKMPFDYWGGGKALEGPQETASMYWNFQKFIVDREGEPRYFFYQDFDRAKIEEAVENLLSGRRR